MAKRNNLAEKYPDLVKEWNYEKNELKPEDYSASSNKRVWWLCPVCYYEWQTTINHRTGDKATNCPVCSKKQSAKKKSLTAAKMQNFAQRHPDLAKEWHTTKNGDVKLEEISEYCNIKYWWLCSYCGNEWQSTVSHRSSGRGCPRCSQAQTSVAEQTIFYYVKKAYPDAENRHKGEYELDIYIPSEKTAIEYDGKYYHNSKKSKIKENEKDEYCAKNGIRLIRFRSPELDDTINAVRITCDDTQLNKGLKELFEILDCKNVPDINLKRDALKIKEIFRQNETERSIAVKFPKLIEEWHPTKNGNVKPTAVYAYSNINYWWVCKKCGHEYQTCPNHRSNGGGCPDCHQKRGIKLRRLTSKIKRIKAIYGGTIMEFTESCKPLSVFKYFELLSSVPHGSGNTKAISDICVDFAKKHGLDYYQDDLNNVIIYKKGSAGRENAEPVIIQGHLDMVCAKNPDDPIDMAKEPIKLVIDGEYLRADNTSLGGDDTIAVAMALSILEDDTLSHPPIEAVFTTDEETGMYGASGLDASRLRGRRMLNIDSEEEGVFTAGCAGGMRTNCEIPVSREKFGDGLVSYDVMIAGLLGGHSGGEIDKERGSSNKLMGRFLYNAALNMPMRLISLEGGVFDNVISYKTTATVAVSELDADRFEALALSYDKIYKNELSTSDPGVNLTFCKSDCKGDTVVLPDTLKILKALYISPYGVQNMSMDIKGLVQTSLNLGILKLTENSLKYSFLIRSSVSTQKKELYDRVKTITELFGGTIKKHSDYPEWEYKKVSPLRDAALEAYRKVYGGEASITATHGGLECGFFSGKIKDLDCISYGPELYDIHSVRERLGIASVGRVYDLTCKILELLD